MIAHKIKDDRRIGMALVGLALSVAVVTEVASAGRPLTDAIARTALVISLLAAGVTSLAVSQQRKDDHLRACNPPQKPEESSRAVRVGELWAMARRPPG